MVQISLENMLTKNYSEGLVIVLIMACTNAPAHMYQYHSSVLNTTIFRQREEVGVSYTMNQSNLISTLSFINIQPENNITEPHNNSRFKENVVLNYKCH